MGEQIDRLAKKLSEDGEAAAQRLAELTPEQWKLPLYTERQVWTAKDLLAHLVAAERGHQQIIASVAGGGPGAPDDLVIEDYNRRTVAKLAPRSPLQLLADLREVREQTVRLVSALSDEDLQRTGRHPALGESATLSDMIRIVGMHVKVHLRDLSHILT